jgi:hypothetical protein
MIIMIIAAVFVVEILLALLVGGFLHDCSALDAEADSAAASFVQEGSGQIVSALQGVHQDRQF